MLHTGTLKTIGIASKKTVAHQFLTKLRDHQQGTPAALKSQSTAVLFQSW